mgnify:FL=1
MKCWSRKMYENESESDNENDDARMDEGVMKR